MSVVVAYTVIYACCFLFGACMFSFLNVLVYRLQRGIPYWKGRSICPSCNHTLRAFDLIPVVGWFLLRGKCRYCGAKISFRYVSVESLGGCLSCLCYWKYGFTVSAAFTFAFLFLLTLVSGVDWDTMEIPNGFVLGVAVIGIAGWAAGMDGSERPDAWLETDFVRSACRDSDRRYLWNLAACDRKERKKRTFRIRSLSRRGNGSSGIYRGAGLEVVFRAACYLKA